MCAVAQAISQEALWLQESCWPCRSSSRAAVSDGNPWSCSRAGGAADLLHRPGSIRSSSALHSVGRPWDFRSEVGKLSSQRVGSRWGQVLSGKDWGQPALALAKSEEHALSSPQLLQGVLPCFMLPEPLDNSFLIPVDCYPNTLSGHIVLISVNSLHPTSITCMRASLSYTLKHSDFRKDTVMSCII